jgi:hypothetical protein
MVKWQVVRCFCLKLRAQPVNETILTLNWPRSGIALNVNKCIKANNLRVNYNSLNRSGPGWHRHCT